MEDLKYSLKQFIESRLQEAVRIQALYPEHCYTNPVSVRQMNTGKTCKSSALSGTGEHISFYGSDFRW
jgi:hypothetical protein